MKNVENDKNVSSVVRFFDVHTSALLPNGQVIKNTYKIDVNYGSVVIDLGDGKQATLRVTEGFRWTKEGNKIKAPGRIVIEETGQTVFNGDDRVPLERDETTIDLGPPLEGYRFRAVIARPAPKRQADGPRGKRCGQCRWWDAREGHRMLTVLTHRGYQNGGYCFPDVVARALAEEHGTPYLHPEDAGYCPKHKAVLPREAAACPQYSPAKIGIWQRIWRWM